ncbi:MAG: hypothetical protein L0Z62_25775 [Gemmataceae bacterium]|nr:hypothetical protein [Gemmataceae bacterium]
MSRMFSELIRSSRRITRDEFAANFGGVAEDVVEMLEGEQARRVVGEARAIMEAARPLRDGTPRLQALTFGQFSTAPELARGLVAAVDGTTALPLQLYSAGQALCVGIGSLSHRRPMHDSLHYWSSRALLEQSRDSDEHIARQEQGLFSISQTAYLSYFEVRHGLEIDEPYLLFGGALVCEWLTATNEGLAVYEELFSSGKKAMGVMKSLKADALFARFAKALEPGEVYIVETLADHLRQGLPAGAGAGEVRRFVRDSFLEGTARKVLRGVFRPVKKAFAFEVHQDHLGDMLRILAADCQLNYVGREIPYLLNRVHQEVRGSFRPSILRDRIAAQLARQSEELFLEETDDRLFP